MTTSHWPKPEAPFEELLRRIAQLEDRVARLEEHERFIAEATAQLRRQTFEDLIKALEAMVQ